MSVIQEIKLLDKNHGSFLKRFKLLKCVQKLKRKTRKRKEEKCGPTDWQQAALAGAMQKSVGDPTVV